jgi:asparagine synthase (glutamine-hydrolysing)
MCGICGFNWNDKKLIINMNDQMKNRGPDSDGHYIDNNISLGHTRLSIIDLSSRGKQPMTDNDESIIITYNGEIYNFQDLKRLLEEKGYEFKSNTDTEVVIYSYKEWGVECIKRFIGMFAFCIYDKNKEILFLARDHIGIKPLYYYYDEKKFIFSSTIPPLLKHKLKTEPNKMLIRDFLLYNTTDYSQNTFFSNINKLPAGCSMVYFIRHNHLKKYRWWSNDFVGDYGGSYQSAVRKLRMLMEKSVKRRLLSDVPVGTCLSGGLDSSYIACLIDKISDVDIQTFSATFPGFEKDESKFIDIVSSKTGIYNNKIEPTAKDLEKELLDFVEAMGEPVPSPSPFAQYKVFQLARRKKRTVILDGQGADELFGGYKYFFGFYIKGLILNFQISKVIKELYHVIKKTQSPTSVLSVLFLFLPLSFKKMYFRNKSNISIALLNDSSSVTPFFSRYYTKKSLHGALKYHLDHKLEHLLKWEDRNSMAASREARVPFLDKEVINFVFTLPEKFIISNGVSKRILRSAMNGTVPTEISNRMDKIGFATPEEFWLSSEPIRELLDKFFIKDTPLSKDYIDLDKTSKAIIKYGKGVKKYNSFLWKSLFLETWLRVFKLELGLAKNQ